MKLRKNVYALSSSSTTKKNVYAICEFTKNVYMYMYMYTYVIYIAKSMFRSLCDNSSKKSETTSVCLILEHARACVHMHAHVYACTCTYVCTRTYIYMYVSVYVGVHISAVDTNKVCLCIWNTLAKSLCLITPDSVSLCLCLWANLRALWLEVHRSSWNSNLCLYGLCTSQVVMTSYGVVVAIGNSRHNYVCGLCTECGRWTTFQCFIRTGVS